MIGVQALPIVALPFAAVYALSPIRNWWALMPAGVLASVALLVFLVAGRDVTVDLGVRLSGVLFLGAAATFGQLARWGR
ncbi:MAG: hypothetical protein IT318_11655 [Anaerolineales bacterium]|nr:hypothetical protein [Anaerolineales bacterium]